MSTLCKINGRSTAKSHLFRPFIFLPIFHTYLLIQSDCVKERVYVLPSCSGRHIAPGGRQEILISATFSHQLLCSFRHAFRRPVHQFARGIDIPQAQGILGRRLQHGFHAHGIAKMIPRRNAAEICSSSSILFSPYSIIRFFTSCLPDGLQFFSFSLITSAYRYALSSWVIDVPSIFCYLSQLHCIIDTSLYRPNTRPTVLFIFCP